MSMSREPIHIIGMAKSSCEKWLAVISGKCLIKNDQSLSELFILKQIEDKKGINFILMNTIVVKND